MLFDRTDDLRLRRLPISFGISPPICVGMAPMKLFSPRSNLLNCAVRGTYLMEECQINDCQKG